MVRADELGDWVTVYQGSARDAGSLQAELCSLGVDAILESEEDRPEARLLVPPDLGEELDKLVRELIAGRVRSGIWEEPEPGRDEAEALAERICGHVMTGIGIPLALAAAPRYLRLARRLHPRPRMHRMALTVLVGGSLAALLVAAGIVYLLALRPARPR